VRDQVLHYIRERKLLKPGDRVAVAVSGGADSVALLRVLLELREELGVVLHVAHFNHQLRGEESDADERFVAHLAREHEVPFYADRANVFLEAEQKQMSFEHAARELRYEWLAELAVRENLNAIATAHNSDDQAETVLIKFLRGAGTRGLGGIYPMILGGIYPMLVGDGVRIIRPLLETPRGEIEEFLTQLNQFWRDDHTNFDTRYTRNRIRHELLPLLERDYNPNLRRALGELAEIARAEEDFWNSIIEAEETGSAAPPREMDVSLFSQLHLAAQRRALKRFLEWNGLPTHFHHVESLRRSAMGETQRVELCGRWFAAKTGTRLKITHLSDPECISPYVVYLSIPGNVFGPSFGVIIAMLVDASSAAQAAPGSLLRADMLGSDLIVRNWLPGDRFRPANSGSEKKLKQLFSEKKIPAGLRPLWPVVLNRDGQIVWVRGFPVAHEMAWRPGTGEAVRIDSLE
jgi:tRNA(Ile)-lysidine synthase